MDKIQEAIEERIEYLKKEKYQCLNDYPLHDDLNVKVAIENLNMVYGMEIKFLTELLSLQSPTDERDKLISELQERAEIAEDELDKIKQYVMDKKTIK